MSLSKYLDSVRSKTPLIHNITNYVTVNDCANILLACGASPIMADEKEDAVEITQICGGLNINIGTLCARSIPAMFAAGEKAGALGHPILLDPVGAGASSLRTKTARRLIEDIPLTVIRGNISEIKTLATGIGETHGVDANIADKVTPENIDEVIAFSRTMAEKTGAVIAISGAIDIITSKDQACVVTNGDPIMASITGSGCMLSAMTTAYITANPDDIFGAVTAAFCAMGVCGEIGKAAMQPGEGNATFRNHLIDAVYNLDGQTLDQMAKYSLR